MGFILYSWEFLYLLKSKEGYEEKNPVNSCCACTVLDYILHSFNHPCFSAEKLFGVQVHNIFGLKNFKRRKNSIMENFVRNISKLKIFHTFEIFRN